MTSAHYPRKEKEKEERTPLKVALSMHEYLDGKREMSGNIHHCKEKHLTIPTAQIELMNLQTNRHTLISAPPARLWSSSREARDVSLAWLRASPKVIPFSFWSLKVVCSVLGLELSSDEDSVCPEDPDEVETWIPHKKLQFSSESNSIVSSFHARLEKQKNFKQRNFLNFKPDHSPSFWP